MGLLAGLAPVGAPAQPPEPTTEDTLPQGVYVETVEVHWVLVPAVVRGPSGYIKDLRKSDFQLTVDGRPVEIESFEAGEDAPVSLHLLQDLSGSMANADKLDMSWRILSFFLSSAEPGDEFAVTTFGSGRVEVQVPFTTELWEVRRNKREWQPYGVTALHDAVAWLPELTVGSGNAKRVAVLVTDGVDNASVLPPAEARRLVRQAELPVYVLGLGTGTPFMLNRSGDKRYRYADVLNLLADQTGGRYASIDGPPRVRSVCGDIWQDLRHQYVLGFRADGGEETKEHTIGVTVRGRKRTVIHRRGYEGGVPTSHLP
jgi:Ca-activated chloride channel family protein